MATQIKQRRDTAANWTSVNPVLAQGEPAVETDTGLEKVGDGATAWASLKYRAPLVSPIQAAKTADYSFTLADALAGKRVIANKATAIAFTILPQGTGGGQVAWQSENELSGFNRNDGLLTLTPGSGVTFIGSVLTFAKGTGFTAVRTASNEWVVLPFSAGSASAPVVDEGASTNVTFSTLTDPDGDGKNYRLAKWTVDGTLVVTTTGEVDALAVAAGGPRGSNNYCSGGGGAAVRGKITLAAATHTVLVGAWIGDSSPGSLSKIGELRARGGSPPPTPTTGYGDSVYPGHANGDGGGAGGPASSGVAGIGVTDDISGSAVEYGKGGQSITSTAAVANTGQGANGQAASTHGADGVVYARWEI
ncbi:MAG: hypothetical protein Q8M17_10560 [Actinomycetota bacterium]|nr:hypothetical protein [Actinomycetota bacterium]